MKFISKVRDRVAESFDGEEGSVFWAVWMFVTTIREFVSGINSYFAARREESEVSDE